MASMLLRRPNVLLVLRAWIVGPSIELAEDHLGRMRLKMIVRMCGQEIELFEGKSLTCLNPLMTVDL